MAKKEEIKQRSPVEFTDPAGNKLTLWFTRATVKKMEREGYGSDSLMKLIGEKPMTAAEVMAFYGLWAMKPDVTEEEAGELVEAVGVTEIASICSDLYMYTYETLLAGDKKNAKWTMTK